MSTLRPVRGRGPVSRVAAGALAAGLVVAASIAAAPAADWRFDPVVTAGVVSSDNVQVASAAMKESDTIYRVAVDLRVSTETNRSEFLLNYQPSREFYDEFGVLDNTSHQLGLAWNHKASARFSWRGRVSGRLSDTPRLVIDDVTEEFVAVPREETLRIFSEAHASSVLSPRSSLSYGLRFFFTDYENDVLAGADLDGDGTGDVTPLQVDDASTVTANLGWERELTRNSQVSIHARASAIDEGVRGETDVSRLELGWRKGRPDELHFDLRAGIGRSRFEGALPGTDDTATDFVGTAELRKPIGRQGALLLGASRDVGGTGGTSGSAITHAVYGSFFLPTGRWSDVSLFARFSGRDPVDEASPGGGTETLYYACEWSAALSARWALQVGVRALDQDTDNASDPRRANFTRYEAGVRWMPTGRRYRRTR